MHYCLLYSYNPQHKTLKRLYNTNLLTSFKTVQSAKPIKSSEVHFLVGMLMWCVEWFKTVCVCSFLRPKTASRLVCMVSCIPFSLLDNISKQKYYMLFGYMKGPGVSDVDLFYHVSCSFGWLSFPWERERLGCFQLIMLSSISHVHAHKWHFQECCLNLQRTKNGRNSKNESILQANINQVKWELLKNPWSAEK